MADAQTIDDIIEVGKRRAQKQNEDFLRETISEGEDEEERERINLEQGQVQGKIMSDSVDGNRVVDAMTYFYMGLGALFLSVVFLQSAFVWMTEDPLTAQLMVTNVIVLVWMFCQHQWYAVREAIMIMNVSTLGIKFAKKREFSLNIAGVLLHGFLAVSLIAAFAFIRADHISPGLFGVVVALGGLMIVATAFCTEKCKRGLIMYV
jgi:hypothetical protein